MCSHAPVYITDRYYDDFLLYIRERLCIQAVSDSQPYATDGRLLDDTPSNALGVHSKSLLDVQLPVQT